MRRAAAPPPLSGVAARSVAETAKLVEAVRRSAAELNGGTASAPPPPPSSSYSSYTSDTDEEEASEDEAQQQQHHAPPPPRAGASVGFGARLFALSLAEDAPPQRARAPPPPTGAEAAAAEAAAWLLALRLAAFTAPLAELGAAAVVDFPEARPARNAHNRRAIVRHACVVRASHHLPSCAGD
jgi:hypothetical protein